MRCRNVIVLYAITFYLCHLICVFHIGLSQLCRAAFILWVISLYADCLIKASQIIYVNFHEHYIVPMGHVPLPSSCGLRDDFLCFYSRLALFFCWLTQHYLRYPHFVRYKCSFLIILGIYKLRSRRYTWTISHDIISMCWRLRHVWNAICYGSRLTLKTGMIAALTMHFTRSSSFISTTDFMFLCILSYIRRSYIILW